VIAVFSAEVEKSLSQDDVDPSDRLSLSSANADRQEFWNFRYKSTTSSALSDVIIRRSDVHHGGTVMRESLELNAIFALF